MSGLIHIGNKQYKGGRMGEKRSYGLTESLRVAGFTFGRLKTGTPPRANKKSINFSQLEIAAGDSNPIPFSMFTKKPFKPYTGNMISYFENGKTSYKGNIEEGKKHGYGISYYENGQIERVGTLKDGKLNGKWIWYYDSGQIRQEKIYKDGKVIETKKY